MVKQSFGAWVDDDVPTHAASLAFYTVFSIAPTLIIAVAVAGIIFGEEAARGEIRTQIEGLVGPAGAQVIEDLMANAARPGAGLLASVLGILILFFGATGVFAALHTALNHIWGVKPKKSNGVIAFLRTRLLSFGMVLGVGFLLLMSLVISAAISALGKVLQSGDFERVWQPANFVFSFGVVTVLFAMIYKLLPDLQIAWRDVWLGAGVTAGLFNIGKFLIGLYLGKSSVASSYGAAGSFAVLLLWIYYSTMVLFLGAEFTRVYATTFGSLKAHPPREPKRPGSPEQPPGLPIGATPSGRG
ncbi:MAG: ribonuclease [Myxococcaceae bacterium]|nr:ribonuclease [Myxococcaceae bacterium]